MKALSLANQSITIAGGRQIAYYDSQSQEKSAVSTEPAAVFLHGFCGSSAYWEQLLPIVESRARILIPDLRGHGSSSAPADDVYEMDAFAEDLFLLLDALHIEKISLFGHSLGGYVSLAFAERHSDRLKSLSLIHSTAKPDSEEAKKNRDKAAAALQDGGIDPFVNGLVPKLFAPAHLESMKESVQRIIDIGSGTSAAGAAATAFGMKARPDRTAMLDELQIPLLLIAGSEDGVIPVENTFTANGPHVSQVLISGAGHMSMVEEPAELGKQVSAFISFLSTI
ncbi:alpha/beta fold hydrolase [Paenibacillus solisilvae]|uniref:Alpha/beta fold hydrolase n=1 Tax=Paenibacillus solisilvae TaxID=2486751 RepID=A0ABW0W6D6_9BACL